MSGWLFVFAVVVLMTAVVAFAWLSDRSAIAEERRQAVAEEPPGEGDVRPEVGDADPTR